MLGHDSEFGLSLGGRVVSALDVLKPFEIKEGRGFPDNMNAEIAINPVSSLKEWHHNTEALLSYIRDQGFDLVMKPVIKYPNEALKHPDAYISGCNPDFSAYTMNENVAPNFAKMDSTRSCGAHVHVSSDGLDPFNFTRWMDSYAALPLLIKEEVNDRRKMYGGAGCLRVKDYGAEYRTLSNVWINDEETREFVWEAAHKAVEMSKKQQSYVVDDWPDIPTAIDTHDINLARRIIDRMYIFGVSYE